MRVCTRCGNVATGQQRYCTRCIAPLDPAEPADTRQAPWWEDDPYWAEPDAVDDWFAGGEAETRVMPLVVDDPAGDGEWEEPSRGGRLQYPSADPRHASAGRRAQIISAALAAVALLAGTVTAWAAFGHHRVASGARLSSSSSQTTSASRAATPRPRPTSAGHRGRAAPTASAPVASPAPSHPGGGFSVLIAPGLTQNPAASPIGKLLVTYFTAINTHNFQQYKSTFLPSVRHQLSEASFARGYQTTRDSNASLVGIGIAPQHGLAATVTFTSTQKPVPSQGVTGCTYWAISLFLGKHGTAFLIGASPPGYHPYHHACD